MYVCVYVYTFPTMLTLPEPLNTHDHISPNLEDVVYCL